MKNDFHEESETVRMLMAELGKDLPGVMAAFTRLHGAAASG